MAGPHFNQPESEDNVATPPPSDTEALLLQMLQNEGWTDEHFRMFMHLESTVLRAMALTNVDSRVKIEKAKLKSSSR